MELKLYYTVLKIQRRVLLIVLNGIEMVEAHWGVNVSDYF